MLDLWTFALLLEDVAPSFEMIEGRVFLDREKLGRDALLNKIRAYKDIRDAQYWINLVPIDDLLDGVCGDWDIDAPELNGLLEIYKRSWGGIIAEKFGILNNISIELLKDRESGDVIISLKQAA